MALNNGDSIADANIIEFDLIPDSNHIRIQYVFASEEYPNTNIEGYPTTVCDTPNDVMAILLSGPGIQGEKNIALIPGTNIPVGVTTIMPAGYGCSDKYSQYSQYYVDNSNGQNVIYNGFTTVLTAESAVIPKDTYHLKLAVADGALHPEIPDSVIAVGYVDKMPRRSYYNSGIFFKAGSLVSYTPQDTTTDTSNVGISVVEDAGGIRISPNPFSHYFQIQIKGNPLYTYSLALTDVMGREVLQLTGTLSGLNGQLATSAALKQLPEGNYFLSIQTQNKREISRFKLLKRE